jgi:protein TonB
VGAIAVLVVGAGIAGALFLRVGSGGTVDEPAVRVAEPPVQPMPEPAGAVAIPEAPPAAPAPAAGSSGAAGRGAAGSVPRPPGTPQSKPGTKPLPARPTPAVQGSGGVVVPAPAAPPASAAAARVYQTVEVDVKPEVVAQVPPVYPEEAAKQNVQDVVVLQVLVDVAGRPEIIKVLRGSRRAPALDEAATAAVRQWTFRPAKKNGQAVPCWFNVGVPFPPKKP